MSTKKAGVILFGFLLLALLGAYGNVSAIQSDGGTTLVSRHTNGTQGNAASDSPAISADGRYVAFYSTAANLVDGDTNSLGDVFVYDRQTAQTTIASLHDNDTPGVTIDELGTVDETEGGATDTYTVVLDRQPQMDVTVNLSSALTPTALATSTFATG